VGVQRSRAELVDALLASGAGYISRRILSHLSKQKLAGMLTAARAVVETEGRLFRAGTKTQLRIGRPLPGL